jgi:hypothetical protein
VAKLTVRAPAGATLVRDGTVLGEAALGVALAVDPGIHTIVVRAHGHADLQRAVTLREGESHSVDLALGPAVASASAEPDASSTGETRRTVGIVLGAAGLVGIGVGTVFGFVSKATYDDARKHCPRGPDFCDADGVSGGSTAHSQAALSTIAFIAGGAFSVGGAALYFTAPHHVTIAPTAARNQAGLEIIGAW